MKATAVFLDRDGTLIEDGGYISDPADVKLLPGAAGAVRRLADLGHLVILASNQSGMARGLLDEATLSRVHGRLEALLDHEGARLDGAYHCPYLAGPDAVVEAYRRESDLRKPKPGMLLQAARELDIDLGGSWMIGDSVCDVQAGKLAGCRTILVGCKLSDGEIREAAPAHRVFDLSEAASIIEEAMKDVPNSPDEAGGSAQDDRVLDALEKIHDQLRRAERGRRQQDFSVLRLFAALLQMFAIVAALWAVSALINDESVVATARLGLACFFQLASISAFAIDRFR